MIFSVEFIPIFKLSYPPLLQLTCMLKSLTFTTGLNKQYYIASNPVFYYPVYSLGGGGVLCLCLALFLGVGDSSNYCFESSILSNIMSLQLKTFPFYNILSTVIDKRNFKEYNTNSKIPWCLNLFYLYFCPRSLRYSC